MSEIVFNLAMVYECFVARAILFLSDAFNFTGQ